MWNLIQLEEFVDERHRELLKAAEQARLLQRHRAETSHPNQTYRRTLHWLGVRLVQVGQRLQSSGLSAQAVGVALLVLFWLLGLPSAALAHSAEHEAAAVAGTLAWIFLVFGVLVIAVVTLVLFTGTQPQPTGDAATEFNRLRGLSGYITKIRLFSRNARLYMLHVVGMDVIYGTWMVMFNLYLLAAGFDVAFIGLRVLLGAATQAVFAIPAGLISDRIGRKLSFVLGDGMGALMSLIAISSTNPTVILATAVIGGAFGALHGVAEPAFMAENSRDYERIHLFSVSDGTRTAAAIIGSALAGLVPLLIAGVDASAKIDAYRAVAYVGIAGWFASLIPAVLLQQVANTAAPATTWRTLFAGVRNPDRIWKLTAPEVIMSLGAGFALPLMNVFFKQNLGSPEVEIGATFAAGEAFLVVAAFTAPLVAVRFGVVNAVVYSRLAALPFLLLLAFSPAVGAAVGGVFTIAGLAHVARITLLNMAAPLRSAFAMELLDPSERSTQVGIQMALTAALSGLASFIGSRLMSSGDYQTPFFLMTGCVLVATLLFWRFFGQRGVTRSTVENPAAV